MRSMRTTVPAKSLSRSTSCVLGNQNCRETHYSLCIFETWKSKSYRVQNTTRQGYFKNEKSCGFGFTTFSYMHMFSSYSISTVSKVNNVLFISYVFGKRNNRFLLVNFENYISYFQEFFSNFLCNVRS